MKTNFVLIMCDQQLREHLGSYGSRYGVTPNLDRLAGEGTTFENAYTACPVCTPARGAIFTGRTPHGCGATCNGLPLYETVPTMGEIFSRHGYRTGYIGKWHLDGCPDYMGSGRAARGFPDAVWFDGRRYLDELAPEEQELGYGSCDNATLRARDLPDALCWATRNSDRAVDFITRHAGGDAPFLLVVSYDEPHPPANCPARFLDIVREEDIVVPESLCDPLEGKPATHRKWQAADVKQYNVNAETMRAGIHRYLACNAYVDAEIGRVLDAVDRHCPEETVVLYTADHGDFMGQFGLTGKGAAMYEQITGVPLLVRAPGRTRPGSRTKALASTMDFIPTLLDLAGLVDDTPLDGTSLFPALDDPAAAPRDAVFVEFNRYSTTQTVTGGFWPIRCIRAARWKLTLNGFDTDELYDLETDPGELHNRIDDPNCAGVRDDLHERLLRHLDRVHDPLRGDCWAKRPWRTSPSIRFTIA
jgi:uncharacterized sulfatase